MSSTHKLTDDPPFANRVTDLSETCNLNEKRKPVEQVQLITPDRISL